LKSRSNPASNLPPPFIPVPLRRKSRRHLENLLDSSCFSKHIADSGNDPYKTYQLRNLLDLYRSLTAASALNVFFGAHV